MKKNWRKKTSAATENKTTIEKTHNVGKQHEKQRSAQKCKTPSKTTGQSAETAAHNKRKAGDRKTTIK